MGSWQVQCQAPCAGPTPLYGWVCGSPRLLPDASSLRHGEWGTLVSSPSVQRTAVKSPYGRGSVFKHILLPLSTSAARIHVKTPPTIYVQLSSLPEWASLAPAAHTWRGSRLSNLYHRNHPPHHATLPWSTGLWWTLSVICVSAPLTGQSKPVVLALRKPDRSERRMASVLPRIGVFPLRTSQVAPTSRSPQRTRLGMIQDCMDLPTK